MDSDGNSYYTNPNYWQEVYDAVCEGLNTQDAIKLLVEGEVYTPMILEHMDNYQAFKYILSCAPLDRRSPAKEYTKRLISEDPKSKVGLEVGLYLGRHTKDLSKKRAYYRGVLEYHPNNTQALHQLSVLLDYDYPETAIPVIKKLNSLDPSLGNDRLGIAYERLGDYKTAWIYFKKELKVGQDNPQRKYGSRLHVDALEVGEPIIPPIENTSVDSASMSIDELERFIAWSKAILKNSPDEGNAFLKKELKAHLQGHKTSFEPVRIVRAYELIERYGEDEGIERLQENDPELAEKVLQTITEKE